MQYIALMEPMTAEFVEAYMHEHGLPEPLAEFLARHIEQPQEDFFRVDPEQGIFVVTDGVTLDIKKLLEHAKGYPHPSPSGAVARAFSESVIEQGANIDLLEVFRTANTAVRTLASAEGAEFAGNPTGRFAATTAFARVDEQEVAWGAICDSYIAHFNQHMELQAHSNDSCNPYAVVNGEERMADQLEQGMWHTLSEETVVLATDGFRPYLDDPGFLKLFHAATLPTEEAVRAYTAHKNTEDPLRFGHERTLIALRF